MSEPVYKLIEINGTSPESVEKAVATAIDRVGETVTNLKWFEVVEIRGAIDKCRVESWQVTLKVGFAIEEESLSPNRDRA